MEKFLKLNDLSSYKMAFHLSNVVWDIVIELNNLIKFTNEKLTI